ncbi:hypothetical protein CDA63_03750 [Hymenobacter amundsenii]|uniref:Polyhydroxyalkanoate synthesis regulator phasin n=1 Tax=Hymenobacter amundsenii TaxID=2006685 RepID=A0A246FRU9_9BACT|nr:hypothetical protein [Hymenobacter amundsenii]OWP64494.1 hypothetical protein CDA63_03750 [Hymenobacter amundsenii]
MEDLFKKFVNAGVGFVSLTNDRVQKTIDSLVKESKLSEKEGAKIMDDLKKNTDAKRKELEKQAQGLAARMMKTVGVAPNSELEELKRSKANKSTGSASSSADSSKKASTSKTAAKAKGAVASATSKAASTVKKAADKTSAAAGKTQKSAAGSAGAAKKAENKADASSDSK